MRGLVFISAQPSDLYFSWQVDVQLHNFKKFGYDVLAHVLIFMKKGEEIQEHWKSLEAKYTNAQFFFYWDTDYIERMIVGFKYPSIIRPYILKKHFKEFPSLQEKAIFYHDADIIFTHPLDFQPFIDDDINYLSKTNYINYDYLSSKENMVEEHKLTRFKEAKVLEEFASQVGISLETIKENNLHTGGAQYILKNIDAKFWGNVLDACIFIKTSMGNANQRWMKGETPRDKENNGWQSWCADMWAVLWNLWKRGGVTRTPKELDFTWATDPLEKWEENAIFHNAGATSPSNEIFYKASAPYVNNIYTPQQDIASLNKIIPKYCSYNYVQEIKQTI